jgi:uncharacterized damage-inducible protein DinB
MSEFSNPAGRAPEAASAYVRSIIALVGDRDPLEILGELPEWLRRHVASVDDLRRRRPEAPGKWSAHDVVQHLTDAETAYLWRARLICAEDGEPTLQGYDQDKWAARLRYPDAPFAEVLEELTAMRRRSLRLVRTLTPAELQRAGQHVERGRETLALLLTLMAGHDLVHRRQLERILAGQ